ncbi:hypothetical protein BDD12DRAFT_199638 [Trichophaea hybrida]|nr:hypothetical protein BDD12DRAFT_199638 [Trichophaea hybrida]
MADSRPDPHHRLTSIIPRTPTPPSTSSMPLTGGAQLHPLTPRTHPPKQSSNLSPSAIPRTSFSASSSFGATSSASFTALSVPSASAPSQPPLTPTSPIPAFSPLSASSIATASPSALRAALTQAQALIAHLRTSSAHQRLLHSLLLIDSSELRARHQVEADISSAQISVLRSHHHPELETYKRRLRRTKRKLAEYAAENMDLKRRLGEEGAEGEGEGLKALGLLASRVLESETPKGSSGAPWRLRARRGGGVEILQLVLRIRKRWMGALAQERG